MKTLVVFVVFLGAFCLALPVEEVVEQVRRGFATGRIIKGTEAPEHAAPYIVSLSHPGTTHAHICGGTIIDREWVITAAHCIPKTGCVDISVIAGLHSRTNVNNVTQTRLVDYGKVHEDYPNKVGPNDIAILHLNKPFVYTDVIKPAVLPAFNETHSGEGQIYGWGQPTWYNILGSNKLQTVTTDILNYEECKAELEEDDPLENSNVCTGSRGKSISSCNGDSGGPLVIEHENAPTELIGIVSWGYIPCGVANRPSVYVRVSAFKDWIYTVISAYDSMRPRYL